MNIILSFVVITAFIIAAILFRALHHQTGRADALEAALQRIEAEIKKTTTDTVEATVKETSKLKAMIYQSIDEAITMLKRPSL